MFLSHTNFFLSPSSSFVSSHTSSVPSCLFKTNKHVLGWGFFFLKKGIHLHWRQSELLIYVYEEMTMAHSSLSLSGASRAWEDGDLHSGIIRGNKPILNTTFEAFNVLSFSFMLSGFQLISPPQDTSEGHRNVQACLKFEVTKFNSFSRLQ